MKHDPNVDEYKAAWHRLYGRLNSEYGPAGRFLRLSHIWAERPFGPDAYFDRVLEVGAEGTYHLRHIRHRFEEYVVTDLTLPAIDPLVAAKFSGRITPAVEDATCLSYASNSFDRLIATHVLEHLPDPHRVLREWYRVLKPGGIMTLVLPCDPGIAWRLGRALGSRPAFVRAGVEYDYWMAREHINPIQNLVAFIRYYFEQRTERWYPMRLPSVNLNLFYVVQLRI